jgi:hypothetical protein
VATDLRTPLQVRMRLALALKPRYETVKPGFGGWQENPGDKRSPPRHA